LLTKPYTPGLLDALTRLLIERVQEERQMNLDVLRQQTMRQILEGNDGVASVLQYVEAMIDKPSMPATSAAQDLHLVRPFGRTHNSG